MQGRTEQVVRKVPVAFRRYIDYTIADHIKNGTKPKARQASQLREEPPKLSPTSLTCVRLEKCQKNTACGPTVGASAAQQRTS